MMRETLGRCQVWSSIDRAPGRVGPAGGAVGCVRSVPGEVAVPEQITRGLRVDDAVATGEELGEAEPAVIDLVARGAVPTGRAVDRELWPGEPRLRIVIGGFDSVSIERHGLEPRALEVGHA
jgi:hypothetical protein